MSAAALLLLATLLVPIYFAVQRYHRIILRHRQLFKYPSLNFLCPITNLAYVAHIVLLKRHTRTESLYQRHKTAPIIRLGPNRLSFSDPAAIRDIYGTHTLCSKGDQYSTPGGMPNLLSVVDRRWHSIKRKRMSAAFTTSHLLDWQEQVVERLQALLSVLDGYCTGDDAPPEYVDLRYWSHLFTLDTIMSIALSHRSSFLETGSDLIAAEASNGDRDTVHLRDCLFAVNRSLGSIVWSRTTFPLLKQLGRISPSYREQCRLASQWTDIARFLQRRRVKRYEQGEDLDDLFACLLNDRSGRRLDLDEAERIAETAHFIDVGSDTTSITLTHTVYCLVKHPDKLSRLLEEIDNHVDPESSIPRYDQLRDLPYLRACLDESMRLRPALSAGMQRETPAQGAIIRGEKIPGNVFVSIPAYVSQRDPAIYPDPESFVPERWLGQSGKELQKYNMAFSAGSRVCIGKNIAYIELSMAIAALVKRYDFRLPSSGAKIQWEEHFNMWPTELSLRVLRRNRHARF